VASSDTFQVLSQRLNLASETALHSRGVTIVLGLAAAIVLLALVARLFRYIADAVSLSNTIEVG